MIEAVIAMRNTSIISIFYMLRFLVLHDLFLSCLFIIRDVLKDHSQTIFYCRIIFYLLNMLYLIE